MQSTNARPKLQSIFTTNGSRRLQLLIGRTGSITGPRTVSRRMFSVWKKSSRFFSWIFFNKASSSSGIIEVLGRGVQRNIVSQIVSNVSARALRISCG